jgi:hypothetical protein
VTLVRPGAREGAVLQQATLMNLSSLDAGTVLQHMLLGGAQLDATRTQARRTENQKANATIMETASDQRHDRVA